MSFLTYDEALEYVAQQVMADRITDLNGTDWENFPELGESDYDAVSSRATSHGIRLRPSPALYEEAYALLASRANQEG